MKLLITHASLDYYASCVYSNISDFTRVSHFEDELFNSLRQGEHCNGGAINEIDQKVQDWHGNTFITEKTTNGSLLLKTSGIL